ncbi:MAG: STT3 domain-containing protein [Candidatus Aenigmatarchaeota archaeon]
MAKKGWAKKIGSKWYLFVLLAIVIMAFMIRAAPARHGELQALDPFYLYRISEAVLNNGFQLPEVDTLRNFPHGDTQFDLLVMHFLPPIMYVMLLPIIQMPFFEFALLYPALMGALAVLFMFFLGKELFEDNKAGLFAAFFLATVQAFITRTSAGFFEKEPTASPFMILSVLFFVKAFKEKDWRYGSLAGVFLGIMTLSWGGSQYIYMLFAAFALVVAILNFNNKGLVYAYVPAALIGIFLPFFIQPRIVSLLSTTTMLSFGVLGIIVLRNIVTKSKITKPEQTKFVTPAILVIGMVVFLIGSMISDFLYSILQGIINVATLQPTVTTTVAESVGGNWDVIVSQTSLGAAAGPLGPIMPLVNYFSLWTFAVIGLLVLLYALYRSRNMILLLPILWLLLGIFGVFFAIRLVYFMGPGVALLAAFLLTWLINKSNKIKFVDDVKKTWYAYTIVAALMLFLGIYYIFSNALVGIIFLIPAAVLFFYAYLINRSAKEKSIFKKIHNYVTGHKDRTMSIVAIPVIIIILFSISFNAVSANTYAQFLGPSINQYWYEAMDFLKNDTPQNTSVLSWWDFGYWFQARGNRATIVDGGGVGNISRFDVAEWFTSDTKNWTDWEPWLKEKLVVSYILMDYTLPGKYGAITKIASHETTVIGMIQFQQSGTFPQDNRTIYEFKAGPYAIWLPIDGGNGAVTGSPMFLIAQGNQYGSPSFVNDLCTANGLVHIGDREPAIGGCVAITSVGVYYVPEEAKNTIFTNLMFMDAAGLPLEKVFDNNLIKIYRVQ